MFIFNYHDTFKILLTSKLVFEENVIPSMLQILLAKFWRLKRK